MLPRIRAELCGPAHAQRRRLRHHLLDMWAAVADVLTFYQERIANEGYLRTARLRDSVLRMARLLDYQFRPGVAATTLLAFTLDKNATLRIPLGLRVQSVPADDEKPQIYETLESILADTNLNSLRILPAPEGFNPLAKGSTSGLLAPGPEGLAAAAISPGSRFVVFQPTSGQIEELAVRALHIEDGRHFAALVWSDSERKLELQLAGLRRQPYVPHLWLQRSRNIHGSCRNTSEFRKLRLASADLNLHVHAARRQRGGAGCQV